MAITYKDPVGDSGFPCLQLKFACQDTISAMTEFELQYEGSRTLELERHETILERIESAKTHLETAKGLVEMHLNTLKKEPVNA